MKGGETGAIGLPIYLTNEDIELITRAYVADAPYKKDFPHPMDPRVKVRLTVPLHPNKKQRCLRAELLFLGTIRDFGCFILGFDDPVAILWAPEEVRVMVQLNTSKVTVEIPKLPQPNYG